MSPDSTNTYQKQFIKLCLKYLPHHIILLLGVKLHSRRTVRLFNIYARKHIIGAAKLQNFDSAHQQQYLHVMQKAKLWHGTGRYQHSQGKVVDVLENIITSGSIRSAEDAYAIFSGGKIMHSISLTRLRIIARCYADMHGNGFRELNRYGDALTWASYYYGLFYARLYGLHYPTVKRHYKTWHSLTHNDQGHNTWGKKVNQNAQDVWDAFGLGSDIPDNYPIIFGLKNIDNTIQLSPLFRDYEVRAQGKINVGALSHIEVPLSRIKEVQELLAGHNITIPIEPLELGELIASHRSFSSLLGYTPDES